MYIQKVTFFALYERRRTEIFSNVYCTGCFFNLRPSLIWSPAFISQPILFIDPSFSSGDDTQSNEISIIIVSFLYVQQYANTYKTYFYVKKFYFSTFCFKKVSNHTQGIPNFINFLSFMFSSTLKSLKLIGTYLKVKMDLIVKRKKSIILSKSVKNQFIVK